MKKIIFISGLIGSGTMILGWAIMTILSGNSEDMNFGAGEIIGFAAMFIGLLSVIFGIKRVRDHELGGEISFSKAFLTGIYITLVISVVYVIGWMIYQPIFMPDFADNYFGQQIENLENQDLSEADYKELKATLEEQRESYKKTHMMIFYTFFEIFPVGFIYTLIGALALKKKRTQSAEVLDA
ncbi:DUF4199 domain-containing protein [Halocola ammonii]